MIPVHLKIAGIYSYREMQEIDFRTLTTAHLFGIFGPVGSGKSAILEAIMFALYGETERLNSRELRAYNMMNLKVNDAFIQFDFLAPGDQGKFRAEVKGKRSSKNKEDVKFERTLYRFSANGMIPVETGKITSILGISYENFRRTIIIPQGKFQEFLQLGAKDRTDMVKELFSLQKFDLSFRTSRLQKKNDEAINICEGRLLQLGDITQEAVTLKEQELSQLTFELQQTRLQLKEKENSESEMQRISALHSDLATNRLSLKKLSAQKEEIQYTEQRLSDFDECVTCFKSDFDLLDNQQFQFKTEESHFSKKQDELTSAKEELLEVENRFTLARQTFDRRESFLQQAKELELIAQINTNRTSAVELAGRIRNGETLLQEVTSNWEAGQVQAKESANLQETLKSQLPDLIRLQKAKDWFTMSNLLKERLETQRQKENLLAEEFKSFRWELSDIAQTNEVQNDFPLLLHQLEDRKKVLLKSNLAVESQLLHLEVQDKLKSLATGLEDGMPCPLCGSTGHPDVITLHDTESDLQRLRLQKATTQTRLDMLGKAISHAGLILGQMAKKQPDLDAASVAMSEAGTVLLLHEKSFSFNGLTEQTLLEEWQTFNKLQKQIEKLAGDTKEIAEKAETEAAKVKDFNLKLSDLRIEQGKVAQNAETLLTQLTLLDYNTYEGSLAETLLNKSKMLRQQYVRAGDEFASIEKIKNTVSSKVQTLSGMVANMKLSLDTLTSTIASLQSKIERQTLSSRFGTEAAVRQILATQPDRANELKRIQHFRDSMASVTSSIQQLEVQLEGKSYDSLVHEELKQVITRLKIAQDDQNRLKGAAENIVYNLQQALAESIKLKAEWDLLATRRENLKTLADLFRGQGFVNFVSTLHLQNLVNGANNRFYRLTRQQLKLELDGENNFRVRDYLNEGQWRNVKTLSGGQTFQASLCLALALADNIQQLNQSGQNFFFLDEGFGTLDRESLELVFETLKTLRRENRIVGVISHVEDLQQEISAWLRITRDDENGSRISKSWD